jgi:hypothetical protein
MRTVRINGQKFELSKSEAKQIELFKATYASDVAKSAAASCWISGAGSDAGKARRTAVVKALGINLNDA